MDVLTMKNNESIFDIRFFHYIWIIDSESLCFVLIVNKKCQGFEI